MNIRALFLKYSWALNLGLIFMVAFASADAANQHLADKYLSEAAPAAAVAAAESPGRQRYVAPVAAILKRDLFGALESPDGNEGPEVEEGDTSDMEETDLRLELVGVWYRGNDHGGNVALIKLAQDQKVRAYAIGDEIIENDATLAAVFLDHVILARANGETEILTLDQKRRGAGNSGGQRRNAAAALNELPMDERLRQLRERRDRNAPSSGDSSQSISQVGENEYVVPRDVIDQALSNLNNIITQARVIPNFTGHGAERSVEGFRIYRIQPNSIFQHLGLKNGDVIRSINGQDMDSLETGLQLLQSLRNETSFSMNIERQRNPLEFSYEVQ